MQTLIVKLEQVIEDCDPQLLALLRSPLKEKQIERFLTKYNVAGHTRSIFALYLWKNGTNYEEQQISGTQAFELSVKSFLPYNQCTFLTLEYACVGFQALKEAGVSYPNLRQAVGRYFPMFAVGDSVNVAVDLQCPNNKVVILDWHQDKMPFQQICSSFEELLEDFISCYRLNRPSKVLPATWKTASEEMYE